MKTARARRVFPALWLALAASTPAVMAGPPRIADDFQARLVANVPAVVYPCQVATAPDGALFIAEDPMDQVGPYEADHGKILVIRDGKDPVLFAEGFRAIFGMAWRDGALYVSHMPYLTVLRDTDGDGKADSREDLFKDLGITNNSGLNDHIVSGLQFGIDGQLYVSVGDKGVLKATGPDGKTAQLVGGGTLRCRPDGTGIEVLTTGTRNHLEPNLDARDNLFTYDNTDDGLGWWTRVTHHVDGGYYGYPYDYHDHPGRFLDRMAEYGGGSPCGGLVYKEDAWPEKYRGRSFWAEWGKGGVYAFAFDPAGASFRVADVLELAKGDGQAEFRPIDLALSYDGKTLYVADWGMGGWGNKTEKVGRVFAITYKGPPVATRPRGHDSDPLDAQFRQLDHPSFNERMRAQAAIIKAGKAAALPVAARMLAGPGADPVALRHLVWVVDALAGGTPEADAPLIAATRSPSADVRGQAARAFGERRAKAAEGRLRELLGDGDPTVRLQAIIALGRIGGKASVPGLLPILVDPDRTLAFSTRQALRRIGAWDEVAAGLRSPDAKLRAAVLGTLELVHDARAVAVLRTALADPKGLATERASALAELAEVHRKAPPWDGKWWGTRPAAGKPPAKSIAWEATPTILESIESGLGDAALPVRLAAIAAVRSTDDRAALPALRARFTAERDADARKEIALALGGMGDKPSVPLLVAALNNRANPEVVRAAALAGVEAIGGKESIKVLVDILKSPGANLKEESQARVIAALGRFKAREAIPVILPGLKSRSVEVRAAAAEALGKIGQLEDVGSALRPLIGDPALDVRKAALAAEAALVDREAIPSMLLAVDQEATRFEATLALAALPDVRALQVYLRGITDKSPDVRKASSAAIAAIRDQAEPVLERLGARKEISPAALPELRKVFGQLQPVAAWHLMGPFPANERPPVPTNKPVNLALTAKGPGGSTLAWKPTRGDAEHGMVDVAEIYPADTANKSAFAAAEVDCPVARPAQMAVGSDDTLIVWLNGKQVYKVDGDRGYEPEMARFDVELKKGKNLLLVRSGNGGGEWKFSVALTNAADHAFLKGPTTGGFDPDRYRAIALKGKAKPDHGKALFNDLKGLACVKCHVVGGQGGAVGPELSGVAAKYPREELIDSVLYPSRRISSGYEPVVIATADGKVLTGLVRSDTADGLEIEDADGKRIKLAKADVEDRKASDVSLMPNGIVEGITPEDFADLIAYLDTLKDASANQGKPAGK